MVVAKKLINVCFRTASVTGTPVQRIVYYFAEAFQDRIDQEWGIMSSSEFLAEKTWEKSDADYLDRVLVNPERTATQHEQPYCLVTQFAATESILENVASHRRVHLIDFSLENGSQWILIMQALAARTEFPLQLLKITAVGTCKPVMEKTGKWLASFAETIHLPFSFNVVVSDLKSLSRDLFAIEDDEAVAIYSMFRLWTFLPWPNHLRAFLGVIKSLKPCVMLTRELEVSTASPEFLKRFDELLFFSGAMFDCLNACCEQHVEYRKQTEASFREMIHNTLTAEGAERYQRQEKIAFWRTLFASFGIVESDLSRLALCQGNLLLKRSDRYASCSLAMDGKCLIMGWNGTPLESLSAWKFH
ncbi:OLC1v1001754C1 [Oldenlandia corymbosa var. corymbosa]|nr:OLC1v1001754C1 [Oldenlandia corymbosa var. corymbosa]